MKKVQSASKKHKNKNNNILFDDKNLRQNVAQ